MSGVLIASDCYVGVVCFHLTGPNGYVPHGICHAKDLGRYANRYIQIPLDTRIPHTWSINLFRFRSKFSGQWVCAILFVTRIAPMMIKKINESNSPAPRSKLPFFFANLQRLDDSGVFKVTWPTSTPLGWSQKKNHPWFVKHHGTSKMHIFSISIYVFKKKVILKWSKPAEFLLQPPWSPLVDRSPLVNPSRSSCIDSVATSLAARHCRGMARSSNPFLQFLDSNSSAFVLRNRTMECLEQCDFEQLPSESSIILTW